MGSPSRAPKSLRQSAWYAAVPRVSGLMVNREKTNPSVVMAPA